MPERMSTEARKACLPGINSAGRAIARACGGPTAAGVPAGAAAAADLPRVLRGGLWNNDDQDNLLSSNRNHNTPENRNSNIGFRCVGGRSVTVG